MTDPGTDTPYDRPPTERISCYLLNSLADQHVSYPDINIAVGIGNLAVA